MNRFPDDYEKPELISINNGLNIGWSAACTTGTGAATTGCGQGHGVPACSSGLTHGGPGPDLFNDPDYLNQTETRS